MKKKLLIIIPVLVLLVAILCIVYFVKHKNNGDAFEPHYSITYQENGTDYACLTFYQDGDYSLYDCDSEPTDYLFDSEWDCKYSLDKKKGMINFICPNSENVNIKVKKWSETEFIFEYKGEEKTFYATKKND